MTTRDVVCGVALAALAAAAPARAAGQLPPLSYVCPMAADAEVIDDRPGTCPKCGMALQPVRLDSKWWCPVHQLLEVHDGPGKCRRDGRELVQVTLAESWRCPAEPDRKLLEPGSCADGQPRRIAYELRAHGDHNPRHGGQFFMAEDQWHHLEGAYPEPGLFRAYFYDNFSKPLPPAGISGAVVVLDANGTELAAVPLKPARIANVLEARLPVKTMPVKAAAKVKFAANGKEQRFDFAFADYSKDPAGTAAPRASNATATAAGTASRTAAPAAPPAARAPSSRDAAPPAAPSASFVDLSQVPPALAEALDESRLPTSSAGLLQQLASRSKEIGDVIQAGNLGQVWVPAMAIKTVALALDAKNTALPDRLRAEATSAVERVVTAAWQLDAYGDLGNRAKIDEAYSRLASAVADLKSAYGERH